LDTGRLEVTRVQRGDTEPQFQRMRRQQRILATQDVAGFLEFNQQAFPTNQHRFVQREDRIPMLAAQLLDEARQPCPRLDSGATVTP
jgi:putative SOS response-associated peptidase YedK